MKNTLIFFVLLCSLYACQKELSDETAELPTNPQNINLYYIDTIYKYAAEYGGPASVISTYQYDGLRRVVQIKQTTNAFDPVLIGDITYEYDGSSMLPASRTFIGSAVKDGQYYFDSLFSYYTYDAAENLVTDSTIECINNMMDWWLSSGYDKYLRVSKYEYTEDKQYIVRTMADSTIAGPLNFLMYWHDSLKLDGKGNISEILHYAGAPWEQKYFQYSQTLTYDKGPNPFRNLNIYKTINNVTPEFHNIYGFQTANNIIQNSDQPSGYNGTTDYPIVNSYYENGELRKQILPYNFYPHQEERDSLVFIYKRL